MVNTNVIVIGTVITVAAVVASGVLVYYMGSGDNTSGSVNARAGHGGGTFVHLFEWRWDDIATECENFLGPKGYKAVQVSPPNEHRLMMSPSWNKDVKHPWFERYQPVSWKLESRSGSRAQFEDMVTRCKAVGVDVYVDAVINHVVGEDAKHPNDGGPDGTSGGSYFNTATKKFPKYGPNDFHNHGNIKNYNNAYQVRNYALSGLMDLKTENEYVRNTIAEFMVDCMNMGVTGFRIDASKHMNPGDLDAIKLKAKNHANNVHQTDPYFFGEVIDLSGGEAIKATEYMSNSVTDFGYGLVVGRAFRWGDRDISSLLPYDCQHCMPGATPGLTSSKAVVFLDNHDNQRGHGAGGFGSLVTFKEGQTKYQLASTFMLAYPFGYPKVMSSYDWVMHMAGGKDKHDWIGPPSASNGVTNRVHDNGQDRCGQPRSGTWNNIGASGGWVCEHRWQPIANMVGFRNLVSDGDWKVHYATRQGQFIAFTRAGAGYTGTGSIPTGGWVAINNQENAQWGQWQTGLEDGYYCNLYVSNFNAAGYVSENGAPVPVCEHGPNDGTTVVKVSGGKVQKTDGTNFPVWGYTGVIIHTGARLPEGVEPVPPTLSYATTAVSLKNGVSMTTIAATVTGTGSKSFTCAPDLPAGLNINSNTGEISGTPTAASVADDYTITVTNDSPKSASFTINIAVVSQPPSGLSYGTVNFERGFARSFDATVTGSNCYFSITPALASGLSIDAVTGTISGTSNTASDTAHTVKAENEAGSTTASVQVKVTFTAAKSLSYPAVAFTKDVAGSLQVGSLDGSAPITFSATGLPAGMSIDADTGAITGTPTTAQAETAATVTAKNSDNGVDSTTTAQVMITVNEIAPSTLQTAYSTTFSKDVAITPITVVNEGSTATCTATGMPAGLAIDANTCTISGTPTSVQSATVLTVTMTNGAGSASLAITVEVTQDFGSIEDQIYMRGTFNGWGTKALTEVAQYTWQTTMDIPAGTEFKFTNANSWTNKIWGGSASGLTGTGSLTSTANINPPGLTGGEYTVTFSDFDYSWSIVSTTPPPPPPTAPPASDDDNGCPAKPAHAQRTVIFIEGTTQSGQDLFLRGGIDHAQRSGCTQDASASACAIPIWHNNLRNFGTTLKWKEGDCYLDWYGIESTQGNAADGTALEWTVDATQGAAWGITASTAVEGYGLDPFNTMGPHHWMLDVDMDCTATQNGWFELKSFISNGPGWEGNVNQAGRPYVSGNHFAKCGKINIFKRGSSDYTARDFP
jgi:alpha-amylase